MTGMQRRLLLPWLLVCAAPACAIIAGIGCSTCRSLGPMAISLVRLTRSPQILRGQARSACALLPISSAVCGGFIDSWAEAITHMLVHSRLSAAEMCSMFLDSCPAEDGLALDVTLDLPRVPRASKAKRRDRKYPSPSTPGLKVLHIADLHVDPLYREGADNRCDDELCCRAENGFPEDVSRRAGFWGDYTKCDSPPRLLQAMLDQISRQHKGELAYVMWTGDNLPHDSWKTSRADVRRTMANVTAMLKRQLPDLMLLPVIGNHDSAPCNYFPPPEVQKTKFSSSWLYHEYAHLWKHWLPSGAVKTLRHHGYYSVAVRPGFRAIVLNTNVAYKFNLWVLLTARQDPHHQLKWLVGQLRSARMAGEKVHLIGHVSPADPDILPGWSHLYHQIVQSYQDTITAQFFSHTHLNEIQLYKDTRDRPFSVTYVAPSLTPWKNVNPGYRIYTVDGARGRNSSWEVTDYERWYVNLTEANLQPEVPPRWRVQMASAAQRYRLKNLSPRQWRRMINKMLLSGKLFSEYYRDMSGFSGKRPSCDKECRVKTVCGIVTSDRSESMHCNIVKMLSKMGTSLGLS